MGQKVNPIGFRTGVMLGWKSRWYASKQQFKELLLEDQKIRNFIKRHPKKAQYRHAGIAKIEVGQRRRLWIWTHDIVDWLRLWAWSWCAGTPWRPGSR